MRFMSGIGPGRETDNQHKIIKSLTKEILLKDYRKKVAEWT